MADQHTSQEARLVEDYKGIWNEGDYSNLSDVVAQDYTLVSPVTPEGGVNGPEELEEHLRELRTGFPDFHVEIQDQLVGDDVVMDEWTVTGTHEGEFNDIPATEREIELRGMDKVLISDGKVQEHRIYHDFHEMLTQLGLADE